MTASCTCAAPFGVPVVPLVKCSSAISSGLVRAVSNAPSAAASSSQRAENASAFQRAEGREVALGNPSCQYEHALAASDAERLEHRRNSARLFSQLPVRQLLGRRTLAEESQRDAISQAACHVAVDGLVGDIGRRY